MKERKVFKMENKIDYSKLTEITVRTQEELDLIPLDFKGRIYVECGSKDWLQIRHNYYSSVEAWDNSSVEAWDNSSVVAWGNSSVVAWGNSSVETYGNSSVEAWGNSSVVAWGNSSVETYGNSFVRAYGNSFVRAYGNSFVRAYGNSSVEAWGNSSVVAYGNSSVVAWGNVQVVDSLQGAKIQISGNARIVYNPKTIQEFMDFFGIKHDNKKAIFYKAVHYDDGNYFSNYDSTFIYKIGDVVKEECDPDVKEGCSNGIHVSTQNWALDFGKDWGDLAILELETDIDKIVLPKNSDGKVRTSEAKVLREVPLEECGLYGKILAKRRVK